MNSIPLTIYDQKCAEVTTYKSEQCEKEVMEALNEAVRKHIPYSQYKMIYRRIKQKWGLL